MSTGDGFLRFRPSASPRWDIVLGSIADEVERLGQRDGWGESLIFKVNLVLEELATNIISYGRDKGRRCPDIEIHIASRTDELAIEISDDGRPFDPLNDAPPAPVIDEKTEVAPVGGLGVHLVRNLMDSLSYRYEGGRNRLSMTARRD